MHVRDAVERDAPAMAGLTDAPESVLRSLVHDRSVRVLVEGEREGAGEDDEDADDGSPSTGADEDDDQTIRGFVSFDAREDAVHVTEFGGDREACERLLEEPIRFAEREGLSVELLLRESGGEGEDDGSPASGGGADGPMRAAVDAAGFSEAGAGPRFRGAPTRRYRYDPGDIGR